MDIFVSYASQDIEFVEKTVCELENLGTKCWYAQRDAVGRYAKAICNAIEHAKVFLLCLSEYSACSEHVLNEVEMAYDKRRTSNSKIVIVPLCIGEIDMDLPIYDEIMYYVRRINFINPKIPSPKQAAYEIVEQNRQYLDISQFIEQAKSREQSLYFTSEDEDNRLVIQDKITSKFDMDVYNNVFKEFDSPTVLDVGCGNSYMLMNRISELKVSCKYLGLDRSAEKLEDAKKYSTEDSFFEKIELEEDNFGEHLQEIMQLHGINHFDIINISMVLLHLKSYCKLLRVLRRVLSPNGKIVIKDIDDGLNIAYPDDKQMFSRIYRICDNNETSGDRHNGREILYNLQQAGFSSIKLEKEGLSTIGMTYDEKEEFFSMYFKFIYGDIKWMHKKYPNNIDIESDYKWYTENYDEVFDEFMKDYFFFSLGFMLFTAKK